MNITKDTLDYAARILWTHYRYTQEAGTANELQQSYYDGLFEMARILLGDQMPDFKEMFEDEGRRI